MLNLTNQRSMVRASTFSFFLKKKKKKKINLSSSDRLAYLHGISDVRVRSAEEGVRRAFGRLQGERAEVSLPNSATALTE